MKTAEEKAMDVVRKYNEIGGSNTLLQLITLALKEQDRDTRHACAEAIVALPCHETDSGHGPDMVIAHEAESACMNVKAV